MLAHDGMDVNISIEWQANLCDCTPTHFVFIVACTFVACRISLKSHCLEGFAKVNSSPDCRHRGKESQQVPINCPRNHLINWQKLFS